MRARPSPRATEYCTEYGPVMNRAPPHHAAGARRSRASAAALKLETRARMRMHFLMSESRMHAMQCMPNLSEFRVACANEFKYIGSIDRYRELEY